MHKQTIKDALFWTVILFNTVLEVPDGMSMPAQIFVQVQSSGWSTLLDKCKEVTKKSPPGLGTKCGQKHKIHLYCKV